MVKQKWSYSNKIDVCQHWPASTYVVAASNLSRCAVKAKRRVSDVSKGSIEFRCTIGIVENVQLVEMLM